MVSLYFVRHGEASSSWGGSVDPGLSDLGWQQAEVVADKLSNKTQPISIYSSPLQRAKDTGTALEKKWGQTATIIPSIAEIPSSDISMDNRREWLSRLMTEKWDEQTDTLNRWREGILSTLTDQKEDAVFFTHFMVLNVIVGALLGTEDIVSFRPDNCSVTKVEIRDGKNILAYKGDEAQTVVR